MEGSRKYKDFEQYLVSRNDFQEMKSNDNMGISVFSDSKKYLDERLKLLQKNWRLIAFSPKWRNDRCYMNNVKIKVKPLTKLVPKEAEDLSKKVYHLLPYVKITNLLIEVDH